MSSYTQEVGGKPLTSTGPNNVSITAVKSITLPTSAQRAADSGVLHCIISVQTQDARWTVDGTTPSATNGIYVQAPALIFIDGEALISAFKIISPVAGGVINYQFTVGDGA